MKPSIDQQIAPTTSGSPTDVELVYSYLLAVLVHSKRREDQAKAARVLSAIELLEEIWPEDTDRWNARYESDLPRRESGLL